MARIGLLLASDIQRSLFHKEQGCGASDASFEVFGEATVAIEPREGTLDDPATRDKVKAFRGVRTVDDLERPVALTL